MTPSSKSVSDGVCEWCNHTGSVRINGIIHRCELHGIIDPRFERLGDEIPDRPTVHGPNQPQQEPMNQDNQVGWEVKMMQFAEKYMPGKGVVAPSFFVSDLSRLIGLVKRDSYAEGIGRAILIVDGLLEEANDHGEFGFGIRCGLLQASVALEEEVKK